MKEEFEHDIASQITKIATSINNILIYHEWMNDIKILRQENV